ncbi:MAG: restriction endonuclease subunit S [Prevotella sp.]|nr:restriction endonuclease subunit S [Prevotella sp.]
MKEGWEYKTLGEVVSFSRGLTYKKSDEVDYSTKVVLRSTNINVDNNSLNIDELKYLNENIEFEEEKLIKKGSILICMSNGSKKHLGKVALIEHDYKYAFGGFMGLLTPVIKINSKYLYYTLTTPKYKEYIKSLSEGANINNLKIKDIQKYIIPIIPIDEQRRIVSYLDSSFKLIDEIKNKALKSLTEAKALFQSALAEAMEPKEGWEEKTLGEIAEIKGGKRVPKGYKLLTEPTNHKYIRVADFNDFGSITLENIQYISDEVYNQIKRYTISSKDVYISIAGTIGKSGIIPKELEGANLTENACKLVLDSCAYKYFVYYFTKSALFLNQIKKLTMISAQPKLALTRLATVNIPLPNLSTQKRIVSHLDKLSSKVRAIEEKYQKMVEECDALKQAMLRDVFE